MIIVSDIKQKIKRKEVNCKATIYGFEEVYITDNSEAKAYDHVRVFAYDRCQVKVAGHTKTIAKGKSTIFAYDYAEVEAFDEVTVFATNNTKIIARGNSIIKVEDDDVEWELYDNASMEDYTAETLEKGKRDGTIKYRGRE